MTIFPPRPQGKVRRVHSNEDRIKFYATKVKQACAIGRISAASRFLDEMEPLLQDNAPRQAPRHALDQQGMETQLNTLFPQANDEDILDPDTVQEAPMVLVSEDVLLSLRRLKVDRASGHSGWTNRLLRKIATRGTLDQQDTFVRRLTALFNHVLTGKASASVREIWTTSRIAFIPKDDASYRPIGIGEVLYRCLGSTVMRVQGPIVSAYLSPLQLAVGVSAGVEIAAVIAALGYTDTASTLSNDIKNAFNSIRRAHPERSSTRYSFFGTVLCLGLRLANRPKGK
jgi:hypothetical protein